MTQNVSGCTVMLDQIEMGDQLIEMPELEFPELVHAFKVP